MHLTYPRVMAGLVLGHPRLCPVKKNKTWMPGIKPGMTVTNRDRLV
jgi:hypothetical protein